MKATTTVCPSFVIQIKSRHGRATMKTPLKASGTSEEPWRGLVNRKYGRMAAQFIQILVSRFRLASPRPFLLDSTNVCPSLSSSSFPFPLPLFLFLSFSSSAAAHRSNNGARDGVMHGRGWLIIPGARPKARNPKHFRRTRARVELGTIFRVGVEWRKVEQ